MEVYSVSYKKQGTKIVNGTPLNLNSPDGKKVLEWEIQKVKHGRAKGYVSDNEGYLEALQSALNTGKSSDVVFYTDVILGEATDTRTHEKQGSKYTKGSEETGTDAGLIKGGSLS